MLGSFLNGRQDRAVAIAVVADSEQGAPPLAQHVAFDLYDATIGEIETILRKVMGGDVAEARTRGVRKHTQRFVGGRRHGRVAPEVAHVVGVHGTHVAATVAGAVNLDVPTVLSVQGRIRLAAANFVIVEIENFFDLGCQPDAYQHHHKE